VCARPQPSYGGQPGYGAGGFGGASYGAPAAQQQQHPGYAAAAPATGASDGSALTIPGVPQEVVSAYLSAGWTPEQIRQYYTYYQQQYYQQYYQQQQQGQQQPAAAEPGPPGAPAAPPAAPSAPPTENA
jgi:hypothetical protein